MGKENRRRSHERIVKGKSTKVRHNAQGFRKVSTSPKIKDYEKDPSKITLTEDYAKKVGIVNSQITKINSEIDDDARLGKRPSRDKIHKREALQAKLRDLRNDVEDQINKHAILDMEMKEGITSNQRMQILIADNMDKLKEKEKAEKQKKITAMKEKNLRITGKDMDHLQKISASKQSPSVFVDKGKVHGTHQGNLYFSGGATKKGDAFSESWSINQGDNFEVDDLMLNKSEFTDQNKKYKPFFIALKGEDSMADDPDNYEGYLGEVLKSMTSLDRQQAKKLAKEFISEDNDGQIHQTFDTSQRYWVMHLKFAKEGKITLGLGTGDSVKKARDKSKNKNSAITIND